MADLIRDAPVGQIIRFLTKNKYLQYPEERADFVIPEAYLATSLPSAEKGSQYHGSSASEFNNDDAEKAGKEEVEPPATDTDNGTPLHLIKTAEHEDHGEHMAQVPTAKSQLSQVGSHAAISITKSKTRADLEHAFTAASHHPEPDLPIPPTHLDDGTILVDWYSTSDAENPQNWTFGKKATVATVIYLYTMAVYMSSSIFTPSYGGIMARFGVDLQTVSLGLSMYVLAYGIGPMLFSPLQELPSLGRNSTYIITFGLFVILTVPLALVDNFAGLIVLRFLQGFFGSPALATGGASLQDMYSLIKLPYVLSLWALAATCGPALGPIISGFSVQAKDWRWSLWEMLWLAGPIWIAMFLLLPETSSEKLLYNRAARLRKRLNNDRLRAQSEIDQSSTSFKALAIEALWRPNQLMLLDPSIAFTALYTALIYGIYYSFFEAFPLVYQAMYGFNLGEMGLTFLSITVGVLVAISFYWTYVWFIVEPEIRLHGLGAPERRLIPALYASFLLPIGLFIFAWTSRPDIHWIASVIGITVFTIGIFIIMQCIFLYLPLTYPQYAASLFAGNDFTRSTLAAGTIHFSQPLYHNLGVDRGTTLLGGLTAGCIVGVFVLWYYGDKLRARSRFAAK